MKLTLAVGLVGTLGAFGCSGVEEDTTSAGDRVVGGVGPSAVLRSTLYLTGGCAAVKVGPRHLLVSARCVADDATFAPGNVLEYTRSSEGPSTLLAEDDEPLDAGARSDAATRDGGTDAGASEDDETSDGGADDGESETAEPRDMAIEAVHVHPSFESKCAEGACELGEATGSDAADVAIITLEAGLDGVPIIPVDLDAVGQSDPVLVVNGGCDTLDADRTVVEATRTKAVPATSVEHDTSPYESSAAFVSRLGTSYVVTPGVGWHDTEPKICRTDIGAPIFRAASAAVVGVLSNYTTFGDTPEVPVTVHYTRLDGASRFRVGRWLENLGVEVTRSCSEAAGGCARRGYDGGAPTRPGDTGVTEPGDDVDGGEDLLDPDAGDELGEDYPVEPTPSDEQLVEESDEGDYDDDYDFGDAAVRRKKKKVASGCSAAPGQAPDATMVLGAAAALGAVVFRRRRKTD